MKDQEWVDRGSALMDKFHRPVPDEVYDDMNALAMVMLPTLQRTFGCKIPTDVLHGMGILTVESPVSLNFAAIRGVEAGQEVVSHDPADRSFCEKFPQPLEGE